MLFPDPLKPLEQQDESVLHAMMVWGESRGEPGDARAAVAYVPITRAALKKSSLKTELLRPWAFSCFNHNDPNFQKALRPVEWEGLGLWVACFKAAAAARDGQSSNPAPGATHYCASRLWHRPAAASPRWFEVGSDSQLVTVLGGQTFAKAAF